MKPSSLLILLGNARASGLVTALLFVYSAKHCAWSRRARSDSALEALPLKALFLTKGIA
jgi:hypothetical protein